MSLIDFLSSETWFKLRKSEYLMYDIQVANVFAWVYVQEGVLEKLKLFRVPAEYLSCSGVFLS